MSDPLRDSIRDQTLLPHTAKTAQAGEVLTEPSVGPDPPESLLQGWLRLFVNRSQPYALQQPDGSYRRIYEPCAPALLARHLAGELTLALSSTDTRGWCRWVCLDVDVPGSLPQLLEVRDALADVAALSGLVEASRRSGHLWLLFDEPVPATAARFTVGEALAEICAQGVEVPTLELYPDTGVAGALGHAVRLPWGVHRTTRLRYPLYDPNADAEGPLPCVFTTPQTAAAFVLNTPRVPAALVHARWAAFIANGGAHGLSRRGTSPRAVGVSEGDSRRGTQPADEQTDRGTPPARRSALPMSVGKGGKIGTRSGVIRWVDAQISPLDLLRELAPETDLRRVGRGYLGWCPFHDDRAPDATGRAGSPSFYVVEDQRYGWSWRCFSTNCAQSLGPMRHSFRLFQQLRGRTVPAAIAEARERWPEAAARSAIGDTRDT